ncbi:hypothetical protein C8J56DRAFT_122986 [Mycena floridula]|nr:hypothetical protein C8J56DRAFT_122986 [Mycena floridula]
MLSAVSAWSALRSRLLGSPTQSPVLRCPIPILRLRYPIPLVSSTRIQIHVDRTNDYEIYVDLTNDPDLGALGNFGWGAADNGAVAATGAQSTLSKVKAEAREKEREKDQWWTIGRGRKDSKRQEE